jgi:sulfur carrier protein
MRINLNGDSADSRGAQTVDDLVRRLELAPSAVLIEHNGVALHRREWAQTKLTEGDQIEVVRVVAGG